jgi:dsDNA-binding SOS-regulon protein
MNHYCVIGFFMAQCLLLSGCYSKRLSVVEARVSVLEASVLKMSEDSRAAAQRLSKIEGLSGDIEAVKAYNIRVMEYVRSMRDDIVKLLDTNRVIMEDGRREYLRILIRQQDLVKSMLIDIGKAIIELQKTSSDGNTGLVGPP